MTGDLTKASELRDSYHGFRPSYWKDLDQALAGLPSLSSANIAVDMQNVTRNRMEVISAQTDLLRQLKGIPLAADPESSDKVSNYQIMHPDTNSPLGNLLNKEHDDIDKYIAVTYNKGKYIHYTGSINRRDSGLNIWDQIVSDINSKNRLEGDDIVSRSNVVILTDLELTESFIGRETYILGDITPEQVERADNVLNGIDTGHAHDDLLSIEQFASYRAEVAPIRQHINHDGQVIPQKPENLWADQHVVRVAYPRLWGESSKDLKQWCTPLAKGSDKWVFKSAHAMGDYLSKVQNVILLQLVAAMDKGAIPVIILPRIYLGALTKDQQKLATKLIIASIPFVLKEVKSRIGFIPPRVLLCRDEGTGADAQKILNASSACFDVDMGCVLAVEQHTHSIAKAVYETTGLKISAPSMASALCSGGGAYDNGCAPYAREEAIERESLGVMTLVGSEVSKKKYTRHQPAVIDGKFNTRVMHIQPVHHDISDGLNNEVFKYFLEPKDHKLENQPPKFISDDALATLQKNKLLEHQLAKPHKDIAVANSPAEQPKAQPNGLKEFLLIVCSFILYVITCGYRGSIGKPNTISQLSENQPKHQDRGKGVDAATNEKDAQVIIEGARASSPKTEIRK